ncbi:SDR family NAD(P)-dependent oxidoreductase [Actinomadura rugatobispora]|uniref:SDR family NAD(P)-dependent oxidoreductase n=1 Tax=Actinomadura rugatobispora TaxID=1994 RepID=A0ABW1A420_9ACTN|nr:SDR family NAD(P)-dependent oxidoreductase [Actinomadura rugatobispora]
MSTSPLTIAITGANSGIGLRAAVLLAREGHRVYALCRDPGRGRAALEAINRTAASHRARLVIVDMADSGAIDLAAARVAEEVTHLDLLINNAAVFDQAIREPRFTSAGHELFWATNHLGPHRLAAALSPLLAAAPRPRLISVASKGLISMPRIKIRFDRLDDPSWYSPAKAYYHAKLAQIMTTYHLALHTEGRLDVACVRVPQVRLDPERVAAMPRPLRMLYASARVMSAPPERLGQTYASVAGRDETWDACADPAGDERARLRGIYIDENLRPVNAPAFAYQAAARARLWTLTQQATGNPRWAVLEGA